MYLFIVRKYRLTTPSGTKPKKTPLLESLPYLSGRQTNQQQGKQTDFHSLESM